jgi:hypothetical protein
MFDEVLDWLNTNGHWINTQRLSTILCGDNVGDRAVLGAIASWMADHDKSMKWRGLARRMMPPAQPPPEPLFHSAGRKAGGASENQDPFFMRYGLIREPVQNRHMAQPVNMKDPANIMFRSRAVFGIGMRADVMAYLMTTGGSHPRAIARTLGYNPMRVQEMLGDLADAGIALVRPVGRSRQYRIHRERWRDVLVAGQTNMPQWVNWRALARGLTVISRQLWAIEEARADEYIFSSMMRSAMKSCRDDLQGSDFGFVIEDDKGYVAEEYLPVFFKDMDEILHVMEHGVPSPAR